jgi:glycosyltransferase involved in cell wall biosynthesis
MIDGKHIAVVVPAFHEAAWIGEVLATMPAFVDQVVVVDDASRDETAACAARAVCPAAVEVLRHATNAGVGAAIVTGYRRALAVGADIVAVMAGDGQMHPDDLAALCTPIARGDADYVKGDRLGHAALWRIMPKVRIVGSYALSALTAAAVGQPLRDSQCGYTAIARDLLARLDLDALWPRYGYPNDLLGAVARAGGRIRDVPVRPVYRGEASGLRARHAAIMLYLIGRAAWRRFASEERDAAFAT